MSAIESPPSRRSQVREALVQAAAALFRARGFEATTVDEIAAAAGVSRRTFFRYFPSKDAVVFPHAEERLAGFEALLRPLPGESAAATLRRACLGVAAELEAYRGAFLLQQQLIAACPALAGYERELDARWEAALAAALLTALGPGRELRAAALAGAVLGAQRALVRRWYADGGRGDLRALAEEILAILLPRLEETSA